MGDCVSRSLFRGRASVRPHRARVRQACGHGHRYRDPLEKLRKVGTPFLRPRPKIIHPFEPYKVCVKAQADSDPANRNVRPCCRLAGSRLDPTPIETPRSLRNGSLFRGFHAAFSSLQQFSILSLESHLISEFSPFIIDKFSLSTVTAMMVQDILAAPLFCSALALLALPKEKGQVASFGSSVPQRYDR